MNDADPLRITAAVFALVAATLGASGAETDEVKFSRAEIARLERGEVLLRDQVYKDAKGRSRGRGLAVVLIHRPPADVWKVLTDYGKHAEFMPGLTRSKVYSRAPRKVGVAYTLKVLFTSIVHHCICTADPDTMTIRWTLDKSKKNDIADTTGYWKVRPHGGGKSILLYSLAVDTGRFVPSFVQDFLTKRDLPNVVLATKKRVESVGPGRKR